MNFTREPIIETTTTPKEGYKLVLRNSKGGNQEEFFVDAVEVISFGHAYFYSSLEKPKSFLVPVTDYEILETRETRVVLKTPGVEKGGIKIGGGREAAVKPPKEMKEPEEEAAIASEKPLGEMEAAVEQRGEKRKERRRFRKKRGRGADDQEEGTEAQEPSLVEEEVKTQIEPPRFREERAALIPPPSTLISETLGRYKDTPGFASAFYEKKEEVLEERGEVLEDREEEDEVSKSLLLDDSDELDFLAEEKLPIEPSEIDEDDI